VNRESAEIATDPFAAELFGDGKRRAGAAEEIGDEIAGVGGSLNYPLQKCLWLLGLVARVVQSLRIYRPDIGP
jgi:hypothetical protein